jgi:hypothetical protein
VIIGWEMLADWLQALKVYGFTTVIFDEVQKAKNTKRFDWTPTIDDRLAKESVGSRSSAAWELACAVTFRIGISATPIMNRLEDLWGQVSIIEPKAWGITDTKFAFRHCEARPNEGFPGLWKKGRSNLDELNSRLTFTLHQIPYSVVACELPPMRRRIRRVEPFEQVKPLSLSKEAAGQLRSLRARAAKGDPLAQAALREAERSEAASRVRAVAIELVKQYRHSGKGKMLVVTDRTRDADAIGESVAREVEDTWIAHGDNTTPRERQEIQDRYMKHPGPCAIVGTVDAWGESKNMQDTDLILSCVVPVTPGKVEQLEGRAHRLGGRPVEVVYLLAVGTVHERDAQILLDKMPAVEETVGAAALDGLTRSLKGLDDRAAVEASLWDMFDPEAVIEDD